MKYILSLLALLLLLPSVAFGQTVQTSWTRDVAKALIYPLYSNDKVGIGTTTPDTLLSLQSSTGPTITLARSAISLLVGDLLGSIDFFSSDASTDGPGVGARLSAVTEGTAGRSFGLMFSTRSGDLGTALSEKMRITSTGNVGVGTLTPNFALEVNGQASTTILSVPSSPANSTPTRWIGTSNRQSLYFDATSGTSLTSQGSMLFSIDSNANDTTRRFIFQTNQDRFSSSDTGAGTSLMVIQENGNVGIGTTSPWTRLAVTGSTTIAGGPLIVLGSANTPISADTDWYRQFGLFRKDINDYAFFTIENRDGGSNSSVDQLWNNDRTTALSYYADLGFNSSAFNNPVFGNLNVANAWYGYNTDGPILLATATTSTAGYFDITTGGFSASRFRITSTGNVGMGTTSPYTKLAIAATAPVFTLSSTNTTISNGAAYGDIEFTSDDPTATGVVARIRAKGFDGNFGGDSDLAFWTKQGSNAMAEKMRLTAFGRLGLGTTSPSAFLHVTNISSTASFLVEDSASIDTTPFIIDSAGKVGIGTTTPVADFQVTSATANATTTTETGRMGQTRGSCDKKYRYDGTAIYISYDNSNMEVISTTACASVTGF